jgi:hypothetical protein
MKKTLLTLSFLIFLFSSAAFSLDDHSNTGMEDDPAWYLYVTINNLSANDAHIVGKIDPQTGHIKKRGGAYIISRIGHSEWIMEQWFRGPSGNITYQFGDKTCTIHYNQSRTWGWSAGTNNTTVDGACVVTTDQPSEWFGNHAGVAYVILKETLNTPKTS